MHRQLSVAVASAIALTSVGLLLHIPAAATAIDPATAVRANMSEVWVRLSRWLWLGHGSASRH
jgi:hypothetical protein